MDLEEWEGVEGDGEKRREGCIYERRIKKREKRAVRITHSYYVYYAQF